MSHAGPIKRPLTPASSSPANSKRARSSFKWLAPLGPNKSCWHGVYGKSSESAIVHKVAAFDLDSTLVDVQDDSDRHHFARDKDDWRWLEGRKNKLIELHDDGFTILIFLNIFFATDKNLEWPEVQRARIPLILESLGINGVHLFLATRKDEYWKPSIGAWEEWVEKLNGGVMPDLKKSFFCGDAAGRTFTNLIRGQPRDHNVYDRLFAFNLGMPYLEPQEVFEGQQGQNDWEMKKWDPKAYDHGVPLFLPTSTPLVPRPASDYEVLPPEVVILVGPPASGKTFIYERYFKPEGYVLINIETAPTLTGRYSAIKNALLPKVGEPHSVVIEDWLPTRASRAVYIDRLRSQLSIPSTTGGPATPPRIRLLWFRVPYVVLKQNSVYRALYGGPDGRKDVVEIERFEEWYQKFEVPKESDEGVDEIKEIRFKWQGTKDGKVKWQRFLGAVYGSNFIDEIESFGKGN